MLPDTVYIYEKVTVYDTIVIHDTIRVKKIIDMPFLQPRNIDTNQFTTLIENVFYST